MEKICYLFCVWYNEFFIKMFWKFYIYLVFVFMVFLFDVFGKILILLVFFWWEVLYKDMYEVKYLKVGNFFL